MKPETFVILIPGFAQSETDSTCLPAQQSFVKLLREKFPNLDIVVIAFQYPFIAGEYNWHQCRVIALGGKGRSKLFRLLLWRRAWAALKRLNRKNNVIGLLSFWCGECALVGSRFSKKYGIPHYCWIMGQDAKKDNRYVGRIRPTGNKLIALSDFIQREFEKNHGIKPQHVIPPGIDPNEFSKDIVTKDIDVLGAGSLIPLKQYDVFVDIISRLKQNLPGVTAVLCGKGPEEDNLKRSIAANSLQNNITLVGELPHPQVLQQMKRSRIFLHTSNYEGFGVVCIEALFTGASVVSFCKPMDEAIPNWYIVDTREEMIQQVLDILRNRSTEFTTVAPYIMHDSINKLMQLFGK